MYSVFSLLDLSAHSFCRTRCIYICLSTLFRQRIDKFGSPGAVFALLSPANKNKSNFHHQLNFHPSHKLLLLISLFPILLSIFCLTSVFALRFASISIRMRVLFPLDNSRQFSLQLSFSHCTVFCSHSMFLLLLLLVSYSLARYYQIHIIQCSEKAANSVKVHGPERKWQELGSKKPHKTIIDTKKQPTKMYELIRYINRPRNETSINAVLHNSSCVCIFINNALKKSNSYSHTTIAEHYRNFDGCRSLSKFSVR